MANQTKRTGKVAFAGIMGALSLVILLFSAIPATEMALPAIAGLTAVPVVVECGRKYAIGHFAAVSILALLLVPSKEGAGLYLAFFGYYGILKAWLEGKALPRFAEWAVKLGVFNAAVVVFYWAMLTFFHLESDAFTVGGVSLPWVFLLVGNGIFVIYDIGLTRLVRLYCGLWGPRLRKHFRL